MPQPGTEFTSLAPIQLPCCTHTPPRGLTPITCLDDTEGIFSVALHGYLYF